MRVIDIEVGQKYRVKVDVVPFFKQGAIEASASCSPDDTFDYITGSQIALARLAQKCGKPAKVYLPKDTKDFQIEFI